MRLFKKKKIVFLTAVLLCSSAAIVYSSESVANESTKSLFDNSGSLYGNEPNLAAGSSDNPVTGELFLRTMLTVLLVVFLGIAAYYLSKKLLPRFTRLSGKRIAVLETVHLGPRKSLHLVKIGNQEFLIGSTNEKITKLADITDAFSETDLPAKKIDND